MRKSLPLVLAVLAALASCDSQERQAERKVAELLRDPSSAQFRNVRQVEQKDGSVAVCGEVNARNGFGGYVGFDRFVVVGGVAHIVPTDFSDAEATRLHSSVCILAGRTLEEVEAETARIRSRTAAM